MFYCTRRKVIQNYVSTNKHYLGFFLVVVACFGEYKARKHSGIPSEPGVGLGLQKQ